MEMERTVKVGPYRVHLVKHVKLDAYSSTLPYPTAAFEDYSPVGLITWNHSYCSMISAFTIPYTNPAISNLTENFDADSG